MFSEVKTKTSEKNGITVKVHVMALPDGARVTGEFSTYDSRGRIVDGIGVSEIVDSDGIDAAVARVSAATYDMAVKVD